MMKYKINTLIAFLLIFSFFSCNNKPEGIISKKKMTHIIADINLLEGSLYVSGIFRSEHQKRKAYYTSIFDKYKVTEEQFDNSLEWYAKNPKELEIIYEQANNILKEIDLQLAEKEEAEKAVQPAAE